MTSKPWLIAPVFALGILAGENAISLIAQDRANDLELRTALHEVREARKWLEAEKDRWPSGYRERALKSTEEAIQSLRTILDVRDLNAFRGVERAPDFYGRFPDHPRLRAALYDLRQAREHLRRATGDFRGLRERAIEDVEMAIGDIITLIRSDKR